jgi:cobalt-zinc-cadmium efflux system protein
MSAGHSHGQVRAGHEKKLLMALGLTTGFMIAEVIGAWITGSLALLSDAAHMFTDSAALAISLMAFQIAKRPADRNRTFGYARFEILASAFNAILLFLVALYILYEAYQRLLNPSAIQSTGMLIVAVLGLVVNLISMRLLGAASGESLNVKGAYLEVWSDMLGSIGVIVAAIVIRYTGWAWMDSLVAAAIGLWVLPRTWTLLRESMNVLLEGVPNGIDLDQVEQAILSVKGVQAIHDLHVWSVTSGKNVMSVHVIISQSSVDGQSILASITTLVTEQFEIGHCTLQLEHEGFHDDDHSADVHHEDGHLHHS